MKKTTKSALVAIPLLMSSSFASAVLVDAELSLVIDVSGSVSGSEYNLMMDGYANAFRDPVVQNNILTNGSNGAIAVNAIFFASSAFTTSLDSYTLLNSVASINAFANTLDNFGRPGSGGTNISAGMNKSLSTLTGNNGFESTNLIMDVSGDGTSSISSTRAARNAAAAAGVTVNGITIGSQGINTFYDNNVITNDGFALHATNFATFEDGVKQKLRIETQTNPVPVPATLTLLGLGLFSMVAMRRSRKES
ncbi:DUF1194 domain-containing protein [Nitrosomonas marina]|uniref:PEP-CTERM protein-sorting domain-containing protein n=1 Tax=Nitrosomonas marina TaxID=917 RepID=A0A1H8GS60_9PROT|nr:DUF1194 domain-containing protein [Nitrosomonas marina]SEN46951.1 PEP-CTERM protein-sorting domain-containing protein [Nitrosomonas marina]